MNIFMGNAINDDLKCPFCRIVVHRVDYESIVDIDVENISIIENRENN